MKFTLGWLKDHLETSASVSEIAERLTRLGLEVESVEDPARNFEAFRTARIITAEKHPDADRLKVCIVDTGAEKIQVVCGAANARAGMVGIFAPAGTYIPGTDVHLKKGVIRGVESNGMMISEREMGLSEDSDGIIDLPPETPLGMAAADALNLSDAVIDVSITPNRADCTGVHGIARDLAAGGMGALKPLDIPALKGSFKSPVGVAIHPGTACAHFTGRYIRGVKNGPSPDWMQKRLKAIGLRPISALVDITNYLCFALARPLHVFDADRLAGNIHVRPAKTGETLTALNDKTYTLDETMTAVCDDSGVLGLGGIIGGAATGCSDDTVNVFVECAYFHPPAIARTGRDLGIISDSRYRFERGIDPASTSTGMEIATKMILDLCGGEASETMEAGAAPEDWRRKIPFDPAYTSRLGGIEVAEGKQKQILESLGFTVEGGNASPPSWRGDIDGRADLVEEILRIHGYDSIAPVSVRRSAGAALAPLPLSAARAATARAALASRGMMECVTWSFMAGALADFFAANDSGPHIRVSNPLSSDLERMRPSPLPNLLQAAGRNADRGYADTALFEVGPAFETAEPDGQRLVAAGVRHGAFVSAHWSGHSRDVDAFDAKADALALLTALEAPVASLQTGRDAPKGYHPGRSGTLNLGPLTIARFGEIHPALLEKMGIKGPASGFEVFVDRLPAQKRKGTGKPLLTLSPFQPVRRDFAFIVTEAVAADDILKSAKSADKTLITGAEVFDVYRGKGVEEGKKSIAISVTIQPQGKTLEDSEIEGLCKKIVGAVAAKTGGVLRG